MIKAVKNTSTKFVIEAMNELINHVGPPELLVTDRGTAYTSADFKRFCNENGISHRLNPVRTPRANGQVERINRTILSMLKTMTVEDKCWDEKIKDIQWSLNTMKSSVTGYTPQKLLYNFTPRDNLQNKLKIILHDDQQTMEDDIESARKLAAERINNSRAKAKMKFDTKHKKPNVYEVGDLVLAESEQPSIGQSRKLEPKYKGPFLVTKVLGKDRYVIEDILQSKRTKRHYSSVYAADKLKRWCDTFDEQHSEGEEEDASEGDSDGNDVNRDGHI